MDAIRVMLVYLQPGRFNPRARDGRDSRGILFDVHSMFQSTRP